MGSTNGAARADQLPLLRVRFDSREEFRREYASNLSNGGIFVATEEDLPVRTPVRVEIELSYCGERRRLLGEVVHRIPPELAETGAIPGLAVELRDSLENLRSALEPLAGAASPPEDEVIDAAGRRVARRIKTRVSAVVSSRPGQVVQGHTRDLSQSGVLISAEKGSIPVGQRVRLDLRHADSGLHVCVDGTVVRHVQGEAGSAAALGIRLDDSARHSGELREFVSTVKSTEKRRRMGGITGSIAELGLVNLLQTFGLGTDQGTLCVSRAGEEGMAAWRHGKLLAASQGAATGIAALARMLAWPDGFFEFHASIDRDTADSEPIALDVAILEAIRLMDDGGTGPRLTTPARQGASGSGAAGSR